MSAQFNALLTDSEWAAFNAGRALAQRKDWIYQARDAKGHEYASTVRVCVRTARWCNHEYLKYVAEYRALQKPQRRRA